MRRAVCAGREDRLKCKHCRSSRSREHRMKCLFPEIEASKLLDSQHVRGTSNVERHTRRYNNALTFFSDVMRQDIAPCILEHRVVVGIVLEQNGVYTPHEGELSPGPFIIA